MEARFAGGRLRPYLPLAIREASCVFAPYTRSRQHFAPNVKFMQCNYW